MSRVSWSTSDRMIRAIVGLISRDAVDELGLEVGGQAVAVVKATNVTVEVP